MNPSVVPGFAEFKRLSRRGNLIPLCVDVVADEVTPVSLLASQWDRSDHCCLLESVEGGEKLGRYSILSFDPETIVERSEGFTRVTDARGRRAIESHGSTLGTLRDLLRSVKPVQVPGLPRFFGGAIGYCSYEIIHELERLPQRHPDRLGWPAAVFMMSRDMFVFDNTQQLLKIITCVRLDGKRSLRSSYEEGCRRLKANLALLGRTARPRRGGSAAKDSEFSTNMNRRDYMASVRKAKGYIGKGDIIQVVLSRRSEKRTSASPLDIYRALRVVNPSPYMYLFKFGGRAIIGSSPESLVRLENGIAATRPIAGTRRRGETAEADAALERELIKDPKERAEHLMLVDLGRNDLGRVCRPGTVSVPTLMKVERYSHVMHMVSEVTGKLAAGKNAVDLLEACFPAGTVAGAPKIRAMEIIDELEVDRRGPYAGAIGYFSFSGNMDMAITIRTILYDRGKVSIQTGAGIVADSNPKHEFNETENKAAGMKATIRLAEDGRMFWRKR